MYHIYAIYKIRHMLGYPKTTRRNNNTAIGLLLTAYLANDVLSPCLAPVRPFPCQRISRPAQHSLLHSTTYRSHAPTLSTLVYLSATPLQAVS